MKSAKLFFLAFIMVFSFLNVFGQQKPEKGKTKREATVAPQTDEQIYVHPYDVSAKYPGGDEALKNDLAAKLGNIAIEKSGLKPSIVYIEFTVTETGTIVNPKILKGVNPELDARVLDFVKSMPNWVPGKAKDRPITHQVYLPFKFWLDKE